MVTKTISNIFHDIGVRVTYPIFDKMNDGKKYKKSETIAKNKKISKCIIIEDDSNEIDGTIEFLKNYIKVGDLKGITQIKIQEYIKNIKKIDRVNTAIQYDIFKEDIAKENIFDQHTVKNDIVLNKDNEYTTNFIDLIEVLTQTEEMWNAFANSNKDKIFEILYKDKSVLSEILKRIYK